MILKEIKKIESNLFANALLTCFYTKTHMLHYLYTTQVAQEISHK